MCEIITTKGEVIMVDSDDFDRLSQWKWYVCRNGKGHSYAMRRGDRRGKIRKTVGMHRVVMNAPAGMQVDHINHDGLDNRKTNLRLVTRIQNQWNRKPNGKASKFKGVCWSTANKKWYARITLENERRHLGSFKNEEDAAKAYEIAAKEYQGEFRYIGFNLPAR